MRDNQQAAKLSRRTVLASLAAGVAANMPAIAAVADDDNPDAELIELGRDHRLDQAIKAADAVVDAYREQQPEPRDVMRHRIDDHICGFNLPIGPIPGASPPIWNTARCIPRMRLSNFGTGHRPIRPNGPASRISSPSGTVRCAQRSARRGRSHR